MTGLRPLRLLPLALLIGLVAAPKAVHGQLRLSGQIDLVATPVGDGEELNVGFRGDGPFNPARMRLFAQHWIDDRIGVFGEVLLDVDAAVRLNGAYVVINELAGQSWLNTRLGLAPSLIGTFGLRSTYFNSNPLVGVPLIWQYRTNLSGGGDDTASGIAAKSGEPGSGLPLLYESCWLIQWELLGELGAFEYSLGVSPASPSNPVKSRPVDGYTWMARVGVATELGLRLGASASIGPYLSPPVPDGGGSLPYSDDPADFDQTLVGVDLEYLGGPLAVHSEAYGVRWEAPLVQDDLEVLGGYVELRWDVLPAWYVAGRVGGLFFGEVVTDPVAGTRELWDQHTNRAEVAVGYRVSREVLAKLDWQRTAVPGDDFERNLFGIQLSAVF